jgi:penicillin-binding protein 1A
MSEDNDLPSIPRLNAPEPDSAPETPIVPTKAIELKVKKRLKRKKSVLARLIFWLISIGFTCLVVGCIAALMLFNHFSKDLPDSSSLANYQPAGMTRLYSADGELIAEYAKERRIFVPYADIPKKVIHAFVAAEDQNFYTHKGIDPMGILRALLSNLRSYGTGGKSLVGGSTITQQVVKNFLLTREKSLERKIKEAILALRITQTYSKDRILELYLNEIYLGMRAYGVAAAAKEFFDKDLEALTTEEAALLAAMPKAPAYYDPRKRPAIALNRRNYVINRMYEDGYINDSEYERAFQAELKIVPSMQTRIQTSYFAEEVRRSLLQQFGEDNLYKGSLFVRTTQNLRAQKLLDKALRDALKAYDRRRGGYHGVVAKVDLSNEQWLPEVHKIFEKTPIYDEQKLAIVHMLTDKQAQIFVFKPNELNIDAYAESENHVIPMSELKWARLVQPSGALAPVPTKPADVLSVGDVVLVAPEGKIKNAWKLEQIPKVNGAMVAMRPQTGEIIALSGGYSSLGNQFNRATQAKRQPGSAFKPFVYLSAFERGFTPSSIVVDSPIELSQGAGMPMWRPKNYDGKFLGPTTLRVGLEKSRNVMTVRLSQMVGLKPIILLAKRLGIYDAVPFNYSTILGAHETTVDRLVGAYAMVANGGLRVSPNLIARVDDNIGRVIYRNKAFACENCVVKEGNGAIALPKLKDERKRVIDERVAYQMVNVLRGVVQRGTAVSAKVLEMDIAGKTGTTNDSRDAWFVGFSSDIVVGGYVGYDQPKDMGAKETGGRVALPAFISFMREYYGKNKPLAFVKPDGVLQIGVDSYSGAPPLPWQASGAMLSEAFVTGGPIFIPEDEVEKPKEDEVNNTVDDALTQQQMQEGYVYSPETGTMVPTENAPNNGAPIDGSLLPNNLFNPNVSPNQPVAPTRPAVATDPSQIPNYQPSVPLAPMQQQPLPNPAPQSPAQPSNPLNNNYQNNNLPQNNLPINHPNRRRYLNNDYGTGGSY